MAGKVKAVPEGTHTITAHLSVREATKAIEFYQKAFGAQVLHVHNTPDGKVMHATLKIGDSQFDAGRRISRHGHAGGPRPWVAAR